jgi:hypothetical protein
MQGQNESNEDDSAQSPVFYSDQQDEYGDDEQNDFHK